MPRRVRWLAALVVLLAVLLLHAGLLARLAGQPGPGRQASSTPALQVRQLQMPSLAQPAPAAARATSRAARQVAAGPALPRHGAPAASEPAAMPAEVAAPVAAADAGETLPPVPGGAAVPRYATRLPPPATLQYTMLREAAGPPGRAGLQAELRWQPAAGRYTLSLGFGAAGWASVGVLDADGVAPERHVESRRGRELRAASFRREAGPGGGRVTFSGPPIEHALLPGMQDRLSWMLQLAAVLEADPSLGQTGREVQLYVVGVRGDAALWAFKVVGRGATELPAGAVADAVHLRREPQRPYDTRVDVWLDPARHHLPVRWRMNHRGDGDSADFLLTQLSLP
ncbi:MAG: hypothetical protein C0505_13000 [Leptothrix sp. (in: Bacteria)]|nr:hypothetical protein [Leptothrix sp. (in: b-proteobacteria)]